MIEATSIAVLRPHVGFDRAIRMFTAGPVGWCRSALAGPMRSIADVYVPYRIYRADISDGRRRRADVVGLDAITGSLDSYHFTAVPSGREVAFVQTSNHMPAALDDLAARAIVESRIQRLEFQRTGFFRAGQLCVKLEPAGELHVPYWIALFGRADVARLAVIDAVRGTFEGAKIRRLLYEWLG